MPAEVDEASPKVEEKLTFFASTSSLRGKREAFDAQSKISS